MFFKCVAVQINDARQQEKARYVDLAAISIIAHLGAFNMGRRIVPSIWAKGLSMCECKAARHMRLVL